MNESVEKEIAKRGISSSSVKICEQDDVLDEDPVFEAYDSDELPARTRDEKTKAPTAYDYDTYMNGMRIATETYGIVGQMIYNRHDTKVYGDDNIFITSEPKNNAPLEVLVIYRSDGPPQFAVYDWGASSEGWHIISDLTDSFVKNYAHLWGTPIGDQVYTFYFQNFFSFNLNSNVVLLVDRNGKWQLIYCSKTTGKPKPATKPSGWSVFEYKRRQRVSYDWASVPHVLGCMGIRLMDGTGNWFSPSGTQSQLKEETSRYKRAYGDPHQYWAYKNK